MAGPLLQCANKQTQLTCNGGKTVMKELRKTRERDNPCYHIMLWTSEEINRKWEYSWSHMRIVFKSRSSNVRSSFSVTNHHIKSFTDMIMHSCREHLCSKPLLKPSTKESIRDMVSKCNKHRGLYTTPNCLCKHSTVFEFLLLPLSNTNDIHLLIQFIFWTTNFFCIKMCEREIHTYTPPEDHQTQDFKGHPSKEN